MPERMPAPLAGGRGVDRRTLLVGAAGVVAAAGLGRPGRADANRRPSGPGPRLERELRKALRDVLRDPGTIAPGAILRVSSATLGSWTGAAGLGRLAPPAHMRPDDRFRAGSIAKPFVATVVLQLAEERRVALDARLPAVMAASDVARVANAPDVTVRMLLGHRSGIADWNDDAFDLEVAREPTRIWRVSELLDRAAAQPPLFAPGSAFSYSNTNYTLLGQIIERATGRSWRAEVTRRVLRPLRLASTSLPAPGHPSIEGAHAHGYTRLDGRTVDLTVVDPSVAGAAGGEALITTVGDLARFVDALLAGRLFRHRATLREMLSMRPAQGEGGLVAYGLGIERRVLPGGLALIGHLGGTTGYRSFVGRVHPSNTTMTFVLNAEDDPTPMVLPAARALAARRG